MAIELVKAKEQSNTSLIDMDSSYFNHIINKFSDISILIDNSGLILQVSLNEEARSLGDLEQWVDKNIYDFLTLESKEKMQTQITSFSDSNKMHSTAFELNHTEKGDWDFPVRYKAYRTGKNQSLLLLGQDLRSVAEIQKRLVQSQLLLEKEYEKFRSYDTRYRVIMETSEEPLVFINGTSGKIIDANSAAAKSLHTNVYEIKNHLIDKVLGLSEAQSFLNTLKKNSVTATPCPFTIKKEGKEIEASIIPYVFRAGNELTLLCRIEARKTMPPMFEEIGNALRLLYNNGGDGIVFTNSDGTIRNSNNSFLALCGAPSSEIVIGKSIANFFLHGTIDLKVIIDGALQQGKVRKYTTKLITTFGAQIPIDVSITHLGGEDSTFGFLLRDTSQYESVRDVDDTISQTAMQDIMKLVGSAPLKELVAETSDVVERLCIQTALDLTQNNRVAASEMLNLSRQSLYVKLRKYDLMDK